MAFKIISTDKKVLTQAIAKEIANMAGPPSERPRKESLVRFLKNRHLAGKFFSPKWAIGIVKGKKYRVNGQHSSHMLANELAEEEFPKGMTVVIDTFRCDDQMDLADLFAQFDSSESARTEGEMVNAHGRLHKKLDNIPTNDIRYAVAGIANSITECGASGKLDREDRAKLVHENVDFVVFASRYISEHRLRRAGIAGAMFSTYKIDPIAAEVFWTMVKGDTNNDPDSPTRVLSNFLREANSGRDKAGRSVRWAQRAFYVKCLHAWNAFRQGRNTKLNYVAKSALPEPI